MRKLEVKVIRGVIAITETPNKRKNICSLLEDRRGNPRDPLSFKGGWDNNIDEKGTSEEQRVYRETVWKDLCRERIYQPEFFRMLFINNIHLITGIKKNMKNSLMNLYDKLLVRKGYPIETINDELKKYLSD